MLSASKSRPLLVNKCTLINKTSAENEYGETSSTETATEIFCAELPINSNEFFKASQSGFKTEKVIVVNSSEFSEESLIEYNSKRYSIYRYYQRSDGYTELYCMERVGNG